MLYWQNFYIYQKYVTAQNSVLCSKRPDHALCLHKLSFFLIFDREVEGAMGGSQMACRA